ncbi:YdcF family protein [Brachybacterium sp. NBEC-018]|uniref:YdcF family protein n=1 Tax=Brachybacterium sp. NBEC-018 TaxID=2996004 RepID=UPI002174D842|nr:YdcF family protein [Brachybacterium sp. NBEC-018]UVY85392.1 YdcF family protein [Brachybacterium sp. NBEC-018]
MLPADLMQAAEALWSYHQLNNADEPADIAIGLGSHDIGVAEHAADLYANGMVPRILFTGANAPTTVDIFPRGEAAHYTDRAIELGVPASAILVEPNARNTGENFSFAKALLDSEHLWVKSAIIVSRPYQQRRAFATSRKLWPELKVTCSSRPQTLTEYLTAIGDTKRVLNMLVGDTQRIWVYADEGFAIPQEVGSGVMAAFKTLVAAGYTDRLIPGASIPHI